MRLDLAARGEGGGEEIDHHRSFLQGVGQVEGEGLARQIGLGAEVGGAGADGQGGMGGAGQGGGGDGEGGKADEAGGHENSSGRVRLLREALAQTMISEGLTPQGDARRMVRPFRPRCLPRAV